MSAITLEKLRGQVVDLDSHEMIPTTRYEKTFGKSAGLLLKEFSAFWEDAAQRYKDDPNNLVVDVDDVMDVTSDIVWEQKGPAAPGAVDITRRSEVMDAMGIRRQLIFPGFGLFAFCQAHGGGYAAMPTANADQMKIAQEAVNSYNEWAGHYTSLYPDRLRIVGLLPSGVPGLTPEALLQRAKDLVATGVKAVMISSGLPPGGVSPADPALDPFYELLTNSDVAMVVHPPGGVGFRGNEVWMRAKVPFPTMAGAQRAEDNMISALVMGGVFERHPKLRFGSIETSGHWIGPLAERLDATIDSLFAAMPRPIPGAKSGLSMKPSEYINRNVRVSVLCDEPVEKWLARYPQIQDVYSYSSDYPHGEGRARSLEKFYERVSPLGDAVVKKFFVSNGEWIVPSAAA